MKKIIFTLLCISITAIPAYCKTKPMDVEVIYHDGSVSRDSIIEEFIKSKLGENGSAEEIQEREPLPAPQMTSQMSIDEKKKLFQKYLSDCGYDNYAIENINWFITWENVPEDFAPSFYKAIQSGYLRKYIEAEILGKYCTNEETMAKINSFIEKLLSYNYKERSIYRIISDIDWEKDTEDFAPSFYVALQKGYIDNYIDMYSIKEYCTNEEMISKMNNLIEKLLSYNYKENNITRILSSIEWKKCTDDFAPSFYVALQNGYLDKYISSYAIGKHCTNEEVMSKINNLIEKMISYNYEEKNISGLIYRIDWSKSTDDFAPSFHEALQKGYIDKYMPIHRAAKYCCSEEVMARMNNLIEKMLAYNYSEADIKKLFILVNEQKETEDFTPAIYTSIEKGYIFKYISLLVLDKYKSNEEYMTTINNLIDLMKSKNYSDEKITLRVDYLYLVKNKIEKNPDLTTEQILKTLNRKNLVQYKTLRRIKNWHDNNIFHDDSGYSNLTTAQAACLFSCYGGITAFIIPPIILVSYIVTELAYIPVGIITKF